MITLLAQRLAALARLWPYSSSALITAARGGRRATTLKQNALGLKVAVHALVVIQMVAREIGENSHLIRHAPNALLRQRVRRNFHGRVGRAGGNASAKSGSVPALPAWCAAKADILRAHGIQWSQSALTAAVMFRRIRTKIGRGLAVGSCNPDYLQFLRGTAVKIGDTIGKLLRPLGITAQDMPRRGD